MTTRELINGLSGATPAEKAARVQSLYAQAAFSPSGIMYSMQRLVDGEVRPFEPRDFDGSVYIKKLPVAGAWEYLHGENSITHAGIYLAAQAYRIQVEDTPAAREQAAKAFRKSGGFRMLHAFTLATIVQLETLWFCRRFITHVKGISNVECF